MTDKTNIYRSLAIWIRRIFRSAPGIFMALFLGAAGAENFGLAARVNGKAISAQRFEHYFEDFLANRGRNIASIRNPEALRNLRSEALEAMIDEELLIQEAARLSISAPVAEVDAALKRIRDHFKSPEAFARRLSAGGFDADVYREYIAQQLAVKHLVDERIKPEIKISEGEIRQFIRKHPQRFSIPEQVHLRLIGLAEPAETPGRCADVLAKVRAGGADFAELALQYSESPGAAQGGDLGWVSRGQLPPNLEQAAFSLAPGRISGIIPGDGACHILKVEERRKGRLPVSEARAAAREQLAGERLQAAIRDHVKSLRRTAKIEIPTAL